MTALTSALAIGLAVGLGGGAGGGSAYAQVRAGTRIASGSRMALMHAAAREFGVPVRLLLAISYTETRWEPTGDAPSVDGGYGLMNLTARTLPADAGRGDAAHPGLREVTGPGRATLYEAARLLHVSPTTLSRSERQNIRGAAAVLADDARKLGGGALPASLGGWYGAVAEYGGAMTRQAAGMFGDDVFARLRRGAALTTSDGQVMDLPPTARLHPDRAQLGRLGLEAAPIASSSARVDCPSMLKCRFVAAGYARDGKNPSNYGNYATAGRPGNMRTPSGQRASMRIRYIIIHDTEGSYDSAISTFQDPASYVSANYVVRSSDGAVTEMVRPRNVSWGAGDWYVNMHAINIENEGFAAQGARWYTRSEYRSDAALVRYLAGKYRIPLDRQHILGHEDVPGPTTRLTATQHWDPGPFFNWNHFMALVHRVGDSTERAKGGSRSRGDHHLVTIDPNFSINKPTITNCTSGGCARLPKQPANFVYLRTGPAGSDPLFGDPILHPGASGTTADSDWGDKATIGETFVFAGHSGPWTAIWFAGRKAWFYNPPGKNRKARYRGGEVITPKPGRKSIPVYGAAYPQASAYPSKVRAKRVVKLAYTIRAGQSYPTVGRVATDYYYAPTINSSRPHDHTLIIGNTAYDQISFNHRKFFVRAGDVSSRHVS